MKKFEFVFVMVIVILLVACGRPTPDSTPRPTAPVSPVSPLPVPQLDPDAETQALSELRVQVAEQLGISDTMLTLVSAEEVTWPDTSLGCPQPDMMYAQVLTPGWQVVFVDATGQEYQVHTDEDHEQFIICDLPGEAIQPPAHQDNPAVEAAIKTLVEQEGVTAASVTVVDVTAVDWPDSCLGCAGPEEVCLMVITPGYRITLRSGAETYALHTDRTGRQAIICTQPGPTPPRSDS